MALILSGDTGVPASGMPTGSVIQTVNATTSSGNSTTSTSFVDTGLSVTITPTSATSKILVEVFMTGIYRTGGTNAYGVFNLVRGSTQLLIFESVIGYNNGTAPLGGGGTGTTYLDSPATTSPVTYKIQFAVTPSASGTLYINNGDALGTSKSTITLLEIHG